MTEKHRLQEILENAFGPEGDDTGGVRSYTGRSMFGRECLGIDTPHNLGAIFSAVLEAVEGEDDTRDLQVAFSNMRTDAMGLETIVYFPEVPFVADGDGGEDHDCEGPSCCTPA